MKKISPAKYWIQFSFANLLIVALLGVVMRYKIAYALPFVDQKHLLHAHSHFAFSGWISHTLMVLILFTISQSIGQDVWKKFSPILYANIIAAYGMLISFALQGYGAFSITFSTASILIALFFAIKFWETTRSYTIKSLPLLFFKAAIVFNLTAAVGTCFLAYFMMAHIAHQNWYLAAVYFYLHFEYNGWFMFTCMGLFFHILHSYSIDVKNGKAIFYIFLGTAAPSYFLSCLWMDIPTWVYLVVVLSAIGQIIGWGLLLRDMRAQWKSLLLQCNRITRHLFVLVGIAFTLKLSLQGISTIPSLSAYAFGFRPVVIGYLHLVLLGVITLYLINHSITSGLLPNNRGIYTGIYIFIAGILLNEVLLMGQGMSFMNYLTFPYSNELLLLAALIMLWGTARIFLAYRASLRLKSDH